jgi:predicted ribosomally synthesized peptide with SipW-like signal peptide
MKESRIELSRRNVLTGLSAAGIAGAGAGYGTQALFTDREEFEGTTVTAGSIDLAVSATLVAANDYYETETEDLLGSETTANGEPAIGIKAADVKPGDWAVICFDLAVKQNPGCVTVFTENFTNRENGQSEPEGESDETGGDPGDGEGELQDRMLATLWQSYDGPTDGSDGGVRSDLSGIDPTTNSASTSVVDGSWQDPAVDGSVGESVDYTSVQEVHDTYGTEDGVTLGAPAEGGGPGVAFNERRFYLLLELPSEVGNEVQSDSFSFDLGFSAVQARNNDDCALPTETPPSGTCECPSCSVDTAASQSPEVTVQSTDASAFPQVSTFLNVDTDAGRNGDLTGEDFTLCEAGCGQDVSVAFTSEEKPVDFVFLMDVTGSMGGELNSVKDNIQGFIDDVEAEGIDARYALYLFGDEEETGPPAVFLKQDLTGNGTTFRNAVSDTVLEEKVGYGGDNAEDNYEAILTADTELSYRGGAQRVMIDITDAPGEEDPGQTIGGLAETRANAVSVLDDYTYIAVSPDSDGNHQKRQVASEAGGTHITLGENFDPILNTIEEEVSTAYRVRYTSACATADGTTRDVVAEIEDPGAGTLYATSSYTAPGS